MSCAIANLFSARSNFVRWQTIPRRTMIGGEYAVLRHKGPYADMRGSYAFLYGTWLPQSGREPADAPCVEEYLNTPRDTAPTELISDIYLPLR